MGARPDGLQHLLRLGGGEDEFQVWRRLFDQLEQGVERVRGDLVRLVNDVDLETRRRRHEDRPLADLPRIVDPAVARGVDLDDVHRGAGPDRGAVLANPARGRCGAGDAVQRRGQDAGARRLAAAARAAEQERMVQPPGCEGGAQRVSHVLLPHDLRKRARPDPVVQRLGQAKPSELNGGTPRAPARACLPLLPSGPGGVHGVTPREGSALTIPAGTDRKPAARGTDTLARGGFA